MTNIVGRRSCKSDRYGDVKLSEAKSRASKATEEDNSASDSASDSESSSSDSEGRGWTPHTEAGFLRVYAALQSGDQRLYDPEVRWFQEEQNDEDDEADNGEGNGGAAEKHRPMYYNEFHRKFLLEGAYKSENSGAPAEPDNGDSIHNNMQEAERIRDSLARIHSSKAKANGDGDDSEGDEDDDFLVKRRSVCQATDGADADPMLRLHRFVAEPADAGDGLEPECKADLVKLKRHWTNEGGLTEAERYLRDYITKEFWRQPQRQQQQKKAATEQSDTEEDKEAEEQLSEDEAFLTRQSEFESRWNVRTDERDPEFESGFKRTFASGDGLLEEDEEDDDDEEELFVVKKASSAAAAPEPLDGAEEEASAELLRLEQRQGGHRAAAAEEPDDGANDEDDEDLEEAEGDATSVGIRSYPRRIGDSLRQSTSDEDRARRRAELRARRRADRLARRREFDAVAQMKAAELKRRLERLRRNAGIADVHGDGEESFGEGEKTDRVVETLGGDFLEEDFDPAEHDRRMASLFGEDFYSEGDDALGNKKLEQKPKFSDDEDGECDAESESVEALRRRLQEEADKLGAEDLIRAGPGEPDLPCRFNYRQVEPNDFGLTAAEILLADDRELNAWCSLRKASQYREREADWRDRRRFRSARLQEKKAQLMPSMMKRLQAAAQFADERAWTRAASAGRDLLDNSGDAGAEGQSNGDAQKKRRRQKKKNKKGKDATAAVAVADGQSEDAVPRSRKKRPQRAQQLSAAESPPAAKKAKLSADSTPELANANPKPKKLKKPKPKSRSDDRLQISEQRLLELGIDPKQFRRMRRQQLGTGGARAKTEATD